jgi:hypothetical protein
MVNESKLNKDESMRSNLSLASVPGLAGTNARSGSSMEAMSVAGRHRDLRGDRGVSSTCSMTNSLFPYGPSMFTLLENDSSNSGGFELDHVGDQS